MEQLTNTFYQIRWWFLVLINKFSFKENNQNFTLYKEWDFNNTDFPSLSKDFQFTPPWGKKINKKHPAKFDERGIQITSTGLIFNNLLNLDDDKAESPFICGGIISKKTNLFPRYGKVEALIKIHRRSGNFPAFWATDNLNTMPEIDIYEFFGFPSNYEHGASRKRLASNIHYGTRYDSLKYKFEQPSNFYFPPKLDQVWLKWSCEFYPNKTIIKINDIPVYQTSKVTMSNDRTIWVNGGVWYSALFEDVGPSSEVRYLRYYKLND